MKGKKREFTVAHAQTTDSIAVDGRRLACGDFGVDGDGAVGERATPLRTTFQTPLRTTTTLTVRSDDASDDASDSDDHFDCDGALFASATVRPKR